MGSGVKEMVKPLVYVALGDSLTEGFGVSEEESFAAVYSKRMEEAIGRPVILHNAGVTGETLGDILHRLRTDDYLRVVIREAELLSLTAGGNDLLQAARVFLAKRDPQVLRNALREFHGRTAEFFGELEQIRSEYASAAEKPLEMRILNLYNPFPMFEETGYWVGRFNKVWQRYETPQIRIVDIYEAFIYRIDDLIGEDMVHPNALGYRVMAEAVHFLGYGGIDRRDDAS